MLSIFEIRFRWVGTIASTNSGGINWQSSILYETWASNHWVEESAWGENNRFGEEFVFVESEM